MDWYRQQFDKSDSTPDYTAIKDALEMMRAEHSYSCGGGGLGKDALKALDDIIEVLAFNCGSYEMQLAITNARNERR